MGSLCNYYMCMPCVAYRTYNACMRAHVGKMTNEIMQEKGTKGWEEWVYPQESTKELKKKKRMWKSKYVQGLGMARMDGSENILALCVRHFCHNLYQSSFLCCCVAPYILGSNPTTLTYPDLCGKWLHLSTYLQTSLQLFILTLQYHRVLQCSESWIQIVQLLLPITWHCHLWETGTHKVVYKLAYKQVYLEHGILKLL